MSEERPSGGLTVESLREAVGAGEIDTVLLAMVDMQGRIQGKRLQAEFFQEQVLVNKAEGCNYQLAVDVEMNPVAGYRHASWSTGYGDFVFAPDLATLRRVPWLEATAFVMCDLEWHDGSPVVVSPRQILRRQIERLAERDLVALAATELEFMIFRDSYEAAWAHGYRGLTPTTRYNVDYSLLDTARIEPLLRALRNGMHGAGLDVQDAKGECNLGQYEINFNYKPALETADGHTLYKNGAKEIAAQHGCALTFMAKFDEREGNSCHIHLSVRNTAGEPVMAGGHELSAFGRHFVAGVLAGMAEFTLFFAPGINSYKRYAKGSFAPTALAWGRDNRSCALRLVGHDSSLRLENRMPGGDVNPHLALAAMIAAGLQGVDQALPLEPPCPGNAYESDAPRIPRTLRDARDRFAGSAIAREAFGEEVVAHYLHMAQVELDAFDAAVTDWERFRSFERM